ncbi:tetratricopeptide repeat protein [Mesonia aquimarina]|uniref:tetratricopeptide repeat protein n=1 Tax=Mesonia aquimarina TaxID=1504967 RepID=UPI000EF56D91|nr:tetratricopeptide repeat protein [Mesonia aquimarina]
MAAYRKRGYKPKNKKEEEVQVEEQSTTAEVFNNLDEGANKTEEWAARNQQPIIIVISVIVIAVLGYLGYNKFIAQPQELEAADELSQAQVYFESALQADIAQQDSLYTLALNGGAGKFGFVDITNEYSGTDAANLAHYYAGIAFLNTGDYQKAIDHLEKFSSDDQIIAPLAKGAIGDAFMQLNQPEEALGFYEKAASMKTNKFTTPRFLLKAGTTALKVGDAAAAEKHLSRIEEEFSDAPEAEQVPVYLGQAKAMQ